MPKYPEYIRRYLLLAEETPMMDTLKRSLVQAAYAVAHKPGWSPETHHFANERYNAAVRYGIVIC